MSNNSNDNDKLSMSYTGRDYNSILTELLSTIPNLTDDWRVLADTDPGVVLLKLLSMLGDNLSYNIDVMSKELMPTTVTQRKNAAAIYSLVGYKMKWYRSARIDATFFNKSPYRLLIPRFSSYTDANNTVTYTYFPMDSTKGDLIIDGLSSSKLELVQGIPNLPPYVAANTNRVYQSTYTWYDYYDYNIVPSSIVDDTKIYFATNEVDQDHIILIDNNNNYWELVDNLKAVGRSGCYFEFKVDEFDRPYIDLIPQWKSYNNSGLFKLFYLETRGSEGKAGTNYISQPVTITTTNYKLNSEDLIYSSTESLEIKHDASVGGYDIETAEDARTNAQRVIGTADTLVTLADYQKYLRSYEGVINCYVSDFLGDIYFSDTEDNKLKVLAYVVPEFIWYDGKSDDEEFTIKLQTALDQLKITYANLGLYYHSIVYSLWNPSGIIYLKKPIDSDKVQSFLLDIDEYLKDKFSLDKVEFNTPIKYLDVVRALEEADSNIDYVDLDPISYYQETPVEVPVDKSSITPTSDYQFSMELPYNSGIPTTKDDWIDLEIGLSWMYNGDQYELALEYEGQDQVWTLSRESSVVTRYQGSIMTITENSEVLEGVSVYRLAINLSNFNEYFSFSDASDIALTYIPVSSPLSPYSIPITFTSYSNTTKELSSTSEELLSEFARVIYPDPVTTTLVHIYHSSGEVDRVLKTSTGMKSMSDSGELSTWSYGKFIDVNDEGASTLIYKDYPIDEDADSIYAYNMSLTSALPQNQKSWWALPASDIDDESMGDVMLMYPYELWSPASVTTDTPFIGSRYIEFEPTSYSEELGEYPIQLVPQYPSGPIESKSITAGELTIGSGTAQGSPANTNMLTQDAVTATYQVNTDLIGTDFMRTDIDLPVLRQYEPNKLTFAKEVVNTISTHNKYVYNSQSSTVSQVNESQIFVLRGGSNLEIHPTKIIDCTADSGSALISEDLVEDSTLSITEQEDIFRRRVISLYRDGYHDIPYFTDYDDSNPVERTLVPNDQGNSILSSSIDPNDPSTDKRIHAITYIKDTQKVLFLGDSVDTIKSYIASSTSYYFDPSVITGDNFLFSNVVYDDQSGVPLVPYYYISNDQNVVLSTDAYSFRLSHDPGGMLVNPDYLDVNPSTLASTASFTVGETVSESQWTPTNYYHQGQVVLHYVCKDNSNNIVYYDETHAEGTTGLTVYSYREDTTSAPIEPSWDVTINSNSMQIYMDDNELISVSTGLSPASIEFQYTSGVLEVSTQFSNLTPYAYIRPESISSVKVGDFGGASVSGYYELGGHVYEYTDSSDWEEYAQPLYDNYYSSLILGSSALAIYDYYIPFYLTKVEFENLVSGIAVSPAEYVLSTDQLEVQSSEEEENLGGQQLILTTTSPGQLTISDDYVVVGSASLVAATDPDLGALVLDSTNTLYTPFLNSYEDRAAWRLNPLYSSSSEVQNAISPLSRLLLNEFGDGFNIRFTTNSTSTVVGKVFFIDEEGSYLENATGAEYVCYIFYNWHDLWKGVEELYEGLDTRITDVYDTSDPSGSSSTGSAADMSYSVLPTMTNYLGVTMNLGFNMRSELPTVKLVGDTNAVVGFATYSTEYLNGQTIAQLENSTSNLLRDGECNVTQGLIYAIPYDINDLARLEYSKYGVTIPTYSTIITTTRPTLIVSSSSINSDI